MKNLLILFVLIPLLMSCSMVSSLGKTNHKVPNTIDQSQLEDSNVTKLDGEFIPNNQLATPDSTKTIIVYNVMEGEKKKSLISDETIRLFIADMFGTITTILTLRSINTP